MLILTIRTDKPEAEIGLFDGGGQLAYEVWTAHRQLAETIHNKIEELLRNQQKSLKDLEGVVCFKGPGSFTGLRIGVSVGNALGFGLGLPVIAVAGEKWIAEGAEKLQLGDYDRLATPEYGGTVYTTQPVK